jgi:hypothetical protein
MGTAHGSRASRVGASATPNTFEIRHEGNTHPVAAGENRA